MAPRLLPNASSTFGEAATGLEHIGLPPVVAGLAVLVFALVILDTFNQSVLGAGTFHNPVNSLGFAAAGKGPFASHVLRMLAQVGGGVLGAGGALHVLPSTWKRTLGPLAHGVKPGVSLAAGVACEFALAFLLNLAIFASMGTQLKLVGALLPLVATIILVVAGSGLTGPSMNPAHAFSWNYYLQGHDITEHMAVFWVAPFSGALLAGLFCS
ncbi:g11138 [Coccomyxa viridis]|uniref:G11138 protein n=1 Tax=Coccomyxa viridis TaxID=1274662 RepID=A0ABP1G9R8_9CHLO